MSDSLDRHHLTLSLRATPLADYIRGWRGLWAKVLLSRVMLYCECYRGADPHTVTPRSDRSGSRETDPASSRIGTRASPSRPRAPDPGGRPERRRGIVLDAELDGLGNDLAARNRPGSDEYIDGKLSAEAA